MIVALIKRHRLGGVVLFNESSVSSMQPLQTGESIGRTFKTETGHDFSRGQFN